MPNSFFEAFNAGLPDLQSACGEKWMLERTATEWDAIAIDRETATSQVASGGKYIDANTLIFVSEEVFLASGVIKLDIVTVRDGEKFSVNEIDSDGDASRTLVCGPAQIDIGTRPWR